MKFESEIINEIVDNRGHEKPSLHYESECVEEWVKEVEGAYPKLCDYQPEWLNYNNEHKIGVFPYTTLSEVTDATVENVVPYAYKSAILKGSTKYHDIDTGEFLETFEDGRNLELVSVKMPVLTTVGKNLLDPSSVELVVEDSNSAQTVTFDSVTDTYEFLSPDSYNQMKIILKNLYKVTEANQIYVSGTYESDGGVHEIGRHISVNENTFSIGIIHNWKPVTKANLKIMITSDESTTTTTYEPYKSIILTVKEDVTLGGIGDVKDTLDCMTGEVTQRIGEVILDGSQSFSKYNDIEGFYTYGFYTPIPNVFPSNITTINGLLCDSISISTFDKIQSNMSGVVDKEGICVNGGYIKFRIDGNKASTVEELKTYLSENPIKLTIPLNQNIVKTVDLSVVDQDGHELSQIKPIEGTMYLTTSGETIKPLFSGEIPIEAITQNLASFTKE